ncbi:CDK5 and ABL1 enzyme substrate 2-like isoform X2 [Xenia sp. Carnegie-2017]|uniref:CDK5 and ABL1 enzyme substrate 2-like isoform X2 n=1 Tax=Xenia sp. Carnegie-2017 TaxID=2897299 RepID=UPI001F04B840|nr:CDK5 and ABL1 enzyme substrate 2-like isoform X2 [Xenia sp. Carnegie-2017]
MAAKAIEIEASKRRKSRRIRAANNFLANISLDGKFIGNITQKGDKVKEKTQLSLDKEEIKLISNQGLVQNLSHCTRPKLLSSFSTTVAMIENKTSLDIAASVSSSSLFPYNSLKDTRVYKRAHSVKENVDQNHKNIICGQNLDRYDGNLCGKRMIICSGHFVPIVIYSTLKYSQHKEYLESSEKTTYKLQKPTAEHEQRFCVEKGIENGSKDWPVSYGHLLARNKCSHASRNSSSPGNLLQISSSQLPYEKRDLCLTTAGSGTPNKKPIKQRDSSEYDPDILDDPELRSGRYRKVLNLSSFMVSIIEYVKPSQLKKDLNEQFKEKFPNLDITLSKLRSLKQDISRLALECSLDHSTVAYTIVYFEKLVLQGKISKVNRKLLAGSCLLLAAKFNCDLKKNAVKMIIENISDFFRLSTKDLLLYEIQSLISLEFDLHLSVSHVLPHLKRLEFKNVTLS